MIALLLALLSLPLPPPIETQAQFAGRDVFGLLGSHRVELGEDGSPLVTVGISRGEEEVELAFPEGAILHLPDGAAHALPKGSGWRFTVVGGSAAVRRYHVQIGQFRFQDEEALAKEAERWRSRGAKVRSKTLGAVFAIDGRMVDTRRRALLLEGGSRAAAEALLARLGGSSPTRTIFEDSIAPAEGMVEVRDAKGDLLARASRAIYLEPRDTATVRGVEHDMGYASHGREDRSYRGGVFVTVDAEGKLAVVNLLRLEDHLRGIVPSEIFASAPEAALRAQAVAARGEVLAKIGARHLADPFHLCAEQHCQVYKGAAGEHPRTNAAVEATRGQLLFGAGGRLVDTVYSSTCGGHTENNEAVWGTPPDPQLRGRADVWEEDGEVVPVSDASRDLDAFLAAPEGAMCGAASFARPDKYRWNRSFSHAELASLVETLGVGEVEAIEILGRGVSGRATGLRFVGKTGRAEVHGELAIRRILGNLNSSLFTIERLDGGWHFRGAGWGHGVGMCQMGAIGRAERGADHEAILRHYYPGSALIQLY